MGFAIVDIDTTVTDSMMFLRLRERPVALLRLLKIEVTFGSCHITTGPHWQELQI
jgi:hypothetical protein